MYAVKLYKNQKGIEPVGEYLRKLADKNDKTSKVRLKRIRHYIKLPENEGTRIGYPYVRHIEEELWELRPDRDRIFFVAWHEGQFILLHNFIKKNTKNANFRN